MKSIKTSFEWAADALPKRSENSNKGSFGRALGYVGSKKYMGAAHLFLHSALRGGAGYVEICASGELKKGLLQKFPEAIYSDLPEAEYITESDIMRFEEISNRSSAVCIGCGSGKSKQLSKLINAMLSKSGATLILDADAINSLAEDGERSLKAIKDSKRQVVLTPHPLELSRLLGIEVGEINKNREKIAVDFARSYDCILVLKGSGTVITDGRGCYINASGSSALAKAGSGDALAGLLTSLIATRLSDSLTLTALAVYVHGAAADNLAQKFSKYGVIPSDLPVEMASVIAALEKFQNRSAIE